MIKQRTIKQTASAVGIGLHSGRNKRDALSLFVNHVLDGIAAAATHTDHLDAGVESSGFTNFRSKIKGHSLFPCNP